MFSHYTGLIVNVLPRTRRAVCHCVPPALSGSALGVTRAAGVVLGARLAHALPAGSLHRLVAVALVATAVVLAIRP